MGKLEGIKFIGSLGDFTAYKVRGIDDIILRTKGGASKKKIMTAPQYVNTRYGMAEFGARSKASRYVRHALSTLTCLADYNIAGPLKGLLRPAQLADKVNTLGQRQVLLSQNRDVLTGFSLNKKTPFEAAVRTTFITNLSYEFPQAAIIIPQLLPGINFFPSPLPYFSIEVVLGVVPDIVFRDGAYGPPSSIKDAPDVTSASTPWLPTTKSARQQRLELSSECKLPDDQYSFVLSIGIKYGSLDINNQIEQVKHQGSAKVLAVF